MNKKILLLSSLSLVLTSCIYSFGGSSLDWKNVRNDGNGIYAVSDRVANYSLSFSYSSFESAMKKADDAAINKSNVYTFTGEMNRVNNYFATLRDKVTVARARYYAEGSSSYKEKYDELYDYFLSFYTWYYPFLLHVRDSSDEIYNSFFSGMNKEEIDEYITGFKYDEKTKALDKQITDIEDSQEMKYSAFIQGYRSGEIKEGDEKYQAYLSESLDNYRLLMEKGNEYASYFSYPNYYDYVYKMYYNRDYKIDFIDSYIDYVDTYVVPMVEYYDKNVDKSILNNPSKKGLYQRYISSNIADIYAYQGDAVDAYVYSMGGSMSNAYNHLKKSGLYIFSNLSNSLGTAFVSSSGSEPLIYFSKDYQNTTTIVHEFGHYFAAYTNEYNSTFPFDIEETHSQANEMLFNTYLTTYYKNDPDLDVYKFIQDGEVYDMLRGVIAPMMVAEVESYLSKNLSKDNETILKEIKENITDKYKDYAYSAYWAAPVVSSSGYYISYATSGVAAVGTYIQAKEDYNLAKANYLKLVSYPEECHDIQKFFDYSGLYSPLKEETFKKFTHENLYSF